MGKSQSEAYVAAGYKPDDGHATRLAGNGRIKARVNELLGKAADKAIVTIESIARQLDEDRQLAFSHGQASAAVAASMAKARLFGLIVDKSEVEQVLRKPLREPGQVEQMSLEQWQEKFAPKPLDQQSGNDAPATKPEKAEPEEEIGILENIRRAKAARRSKTGSLLTGFGSR